MRLPVAGETRIKPSYPLPTTISILKVEGDSVTVKWGSREPGVLTMAMFLSQGFGLLTTIDK